MILEEFYLVFQKGSDCFELKVENRPVDGENSVMGKNKGRRERKAERRSRGGGVKWKGGWGEHSKTEKTQFFS